MSALRLSPKRTRAPAAHLCAFAPGVPLPLSPCLVRCVSGRAPPAHAHAHAFARRRHRSGRVRALVRMGDEEGEKKKKEEEGEDATTARVRASLLADGVQLDELLNAGKVVRLSHEVETLERAATGLAAGSAEARDVARRLERAEGALAVEKRQVMQTWLKRVFVVQAGVFVVVGGMLANDLVPGWEVPLVGRALGFWTTWLFTIPALRARKGMRKAEKSALNVAFVATPVMNVALPAVTKEFGVIWAADVALLAACYLWYGVKAAREGEREGEERSGVEDVGKEQGRIKGILKYLDWGSWR